MGLVEKAGRPNERKTKTQYQDETPMRAFFPAGGGGRPVPGRTNGTYVRAQRVYSIPLVLQYSILGVLEFTHMHVHVYVYTCTCTYVRYVLEYVLARVSRYDSVCGRRYRTDTYMGVAQTNGQQRSALSMCGKVQQWSAAPSEQVSGVLVIIN